MFKRSKYGAKKCGKYDSKKEAKRAFELELLQRGGQIKDLQTHVRYDLASPCGKYVMRTPTGRVMQYEADFVYWDCAKNCQIVEDVKGVDTPLSAVKREVLRMFLGIAVKIV